MSDNFDDGDLNGWIHENPDAGVPGKFYADSGEAIFESSKDQGSVGSGIKTGSDTWVNYAVEVDIKITKHDFNAMGWEIAGLVLRRTSIGHYSFFIGSLVGQKVIAICRMFGNQNIAISLTNKQYDWKIDTLYHLKAVVFDNKISFYINDELQLEIQDNTFKMGCVGLIGAWVYTHARFDNFTISGDEIPDMEINSFGVELKDKLPIIWGSIKSIR